MSIKVTIKDGNYGYDVDKGQSFVKDYVEKFKDTQVLAAMALFFGYIEDGYDVKLEYKATK